MGMSYKSPLKTLAKCRGNKCTRFKSTEKYIKGAKWTKTSAVESHGLVKQEKSDKETGRRKF